MSLHPQVADPQPTEEDTPASSIHGDETEGNADGKAGGVEANGAPITGPPAVPDPSQHPQPVDPG